MCIVKTLARVHTLQFSQHFCETEDDDNDLGHNLFKCAKFIHGLSFKLKSTDFTHLTRSMISLPVVILFAV